MLNLFGETSFNVDGLAPSDSLFICMFSISSCATSNESWGRVSFMTTSQLQHGLKAGNYYFFIQPSKSNTLASLEPLAPALDQVIQ